MEPGHEDREYARRHTSSGWCSHASMEPGHEDREYAGFVVARVHEAEASMEPGHEDREYSQVWFTLLRVEPPQWSPVMKTGNTGPATSSPAEAARLNGARS